MEPYEHCEIARMIEAALKPLATQHGFVVRMKGGWCDLAAGGQFTIEFAPLSDDGVALDSDARFFELSAENFGLRPDHLGATFVFKGHTYRIVGMRRGRENGVVSELEDGMRKILGENTVIAEHEDGTQILFRAEMIEAILSGHLEWWFRWAR